MTAAPAAAAALVAAAAVATAAAIAAEEVRDDIRTGGAATVFADGQTAFSFPAANLTDPERTRFVIGNSFFRRNWVEAPASTRARDGLGPHFIARSCGGCHVQDGRGPPPEMKGGRNVEQPVALLFRLSVPGRDGAVPDPVYGDQFATQAVRGVRPEGRVSISTRTVAGRFADGTRYRLEAPRYRFTDLGYGPLGQGLMVSPRLAPQVIGVGLLEAIPEAEILANADAQARAGGPVRGVPNRVFDVAAGRELIGRFGWKANVATLAHQTAAAFRGDIGITSRLFPDEACTPRQTDCLAAPRGGKGAPEIDDETFDQVVFYQATVAPPARRDADDPRVRTGQRLFSEAGCAVCHRPSYRTGEPPLAAIYPRFSSPALVGQTIWPYTDLLLHDMGPELADGRPDFLADGRQWRTPPLWGIGLIRQVNGHQRLLHDGRARGVLEAILWHGGEAAASRDRVKGLSASDRAALVRFVESL
ncbi:MAG: di-heme oxidoredictase family protein [Lautropia sp.]